MRKSCLTAILAGAGMLVLILDSKAALSAASEGIALCLQTVIPSLFPFFILSMLLTSTLSGRSLSLFAPLCNALGVPKGAESIVAVGFLGGYPIGAQCTAQAVRNGYISRENGRRMLSFCSNAGPAFLFGIGSRLFSRMWMCWALWGIHMLSALVVGLLTAAEDADTAVLPPSKAMGLSDALSSAVKTMAMVCGWVVIFRVLLSFCQRWFLWALPVWGQNLFSGLLELTNGCCSLVLVEEEGLRFVLFSLMLGFGGLCVLMQTYGVCNGVDVSLYLPGKIAQALLSGALAGLVISREMAVAALCFVIGITACAAYYHFSRKEQKNLAFPAGLVYNKKNLHTR